MIYKPGVGCTMNNSTLPKLPVVTLPTFTDIQYTPPGQVMTSPIVLFNIYIGDFDSNATLRRTRNLTDYFAAHIGSSPWYHALSSYYQVVLGTVQNASNSATFARSMSIPSPGPTQTPYRISDRNISQALRTIITGNSGLLRQNNVFVFIFRGDYSVTASDGSQWGRDWCSYHSSIYFGRQGASVGYAVIGEASLAAAGSAARSNCLQLPVAVASNPPNGNLGADNLASPYAFSLFGIVTNFLGNAWTFPANAYPQQNPCCGSFGPVPSGVNYNMVLGCKRFLVQEIFLPKRGCVLPMNLPLPSAEPSAAPSSSPSFRPSPIPSGKPSSIPSPSPSSMRPSFKPTSPTSALSPAPPSLRSSASSPAPTQSRSQGPVSSGPKLLPSSPPSSPLKPSPNPTIIRAPLPLPLPLPLPSGSPLLPTLASPSVGPPAPPVDILYQPPQPVLTRPQNIYHIYIGEFNQATKDLLDYFAAHVGNSTWLQMLTAYYQVDINGVKSFASGNAHFIRSVSTLPAARGLSISDQNIRNIVLSYVQTGGLPLDPNGLYSVFFRGDFQITDWPQLWCGYHSSIFVTETQLLNYIVVGDPSSSSSSSAVNCMVAAAALSGPSRLTANNDPADNMIPTYGAQLAGTITDFMVNLMHIVIYQSIEMTLTRGLGALRMGRKWAMSAGAITELSMRRAMPI